MNDVVIRPLRFTGDVQAMRTFLETLGLRSRIESESGVWVDMVAGRGMVALHDSTRADSGAERLLGALGGDNPELVSFGAASDFEVRIELTTTENLDEVAARLTDAGYRPEKVDGGLSVVDPDGQTVRVHG